MRSYNNFRIPKPTQSELLVRKILTENGLLFEHGQVIWYTEDEKYTPDLIIGKKGKRLIVEVDGKIHENMYQKNKDRIRQRALKNMGYTVFRVKNEEVQRRPDIVAAKIMGEYSQLIAEDSKKEITITELKKPLDYQSIPSEIDNKLNDWVISFNKELNDEKWSIDYFRETLSLFHPELVKNKSAMEKMILLLHGLNLRKMEDGNLDFEYSLSFFKKSIHLLNGMFGQDNMVGIHLKNMFNKTAPNFFKNLIFQGGPNIKKGFVSIKDKDTLNYHIDNFNKNLSELGITVEPSDIKQECRAKLQVLDKKEKQIYNWLIEWMNYS